MVNYLSSNNVRPILVHTNICKYQHSSIIYQTTCGVTPYYYTLFHFKASNMEFVLNNSKQHKQNSKLRYLLLTIITRYNILTMDII